MIIFDFDQTLVDTHPVEHLRAARKWSQVMAQVSGLAVYGGIHDLLEALHNAGIPMAIVTKSPSMVSKAIVKQHDWPIDIIVGYHDVSRQKPDPEGLLKAIKQAVADPSKSFHVGDQPQDTLAARAAGVTALGSAWGIPDTAALVASKPDEIFSRVADLHTYLNKRLLLD